MKFKKAILTLLLIICCVFLFTGCATVSYSVVEQESGGVEQVVEIELDQRQLVKAGATQTQIDEIKNKILSRMSQIKDNLYTSFQSRLVNDSDLSVSQKEHYFQSLSLKTYTNDGAMGIKMSFADVASYYYFYEIDPNEESDTEIIEQNQNLFFSKYIQSTKTIFSDSELIQPLIDEANSYIQSLNLPKPTQIKAPNFCYSYRSTNSKLYSDADTRVLDSNGGYIHTWYIASDETQREINFYTIQPRRVVWYVLALIVVFIFVAIMFIVYFVKKKKAKKDEVEIIEPD